MTEVYKPWKATVHTQIWEMLERFRALPDKGMDTPQDDAGIGVWMIHAPWMAAAVWSWHYVSLIHLRDLPNQSRRPHLSFEGATHELIAYAIDPKLVLDLSAGQIPRMQFLSPVSIVQQFGPCTDAEALRKVESCLEMVVHGQLTVEADGRHVWHHLLRECAHV